MDGVCCGRRPAATAMAQHHLPDVVVAEGSAPAATVFDTLGQLRATPLTANIPVVVIASSVQFDMPVHTSPGDYSGTPEAR